MTLIKQTAGFLLCGDFVPRGETVVMSTLRFRHTGPHEVGRCCQEVEQGKYCGAIAAYVAEADGGSAYLCARHPPPPQSIIEED